MAATFDWQADHGAATGSPAKGTTRNTAVANNNYKNADDEATGYTSAPITAGNNSYERWLFGAFSGTFNLILNGLFAHTAGTLVAGTPVKGPPACTSDGTRLLYTTPSVSANANLVHDFHNADGVTPDTIGNGVEVRFSATGPEATGKAASMATNPCYTNYLTTQMQTTGAAVAGDTTSITLTLRYDEN